MIEAGPECLAPAAIKKNIPVPIIELIVMSSIAGKLSIFFNSPIKIYYSLRYIN
jgi:hypothetical protein